MNSEDHRQFEVRKMDHLRIALDPRMQTSGGSSFERVQLVHEALPEINLSEVQINQEIFAQKLASPLFISSMTAGHSLGREINIRLAQSSSEKNWLMAVGSQRRELDDSSAKEEWKAIRASAPKAKLFGNIGLAQLIHTPMDNLLRLADNLQACGMFVHTNPLQEALQFEGTPYFKGGLLALERFAKALDERFKIPLVLKEVGSGFSELTLLRVNNLGLAAVDLAGLGGTHWGRVEYAREKSSQDGRGTFQDWGISTVDSMMAAHKLRHEGRISYKVWGSGGVRSGLDAAKLLAMGAQMVGLAQPLMAACVHDLQTGQETLPNLMTKLENELRISLFCTGAVDLNIFQAKGVWHYV